MLTRNCKAILFISTNLGCIVRDTDGVTQSMSSTIQFNALRQNLAIFVGNGTTAPTIDDLDLESEINTLTKMSGGNTTSTGYAGNTYENNYIGNIYATFKNDTANNITVTELGVKADNINISGSYKQVLMIRETFDPVVIAPGETYSFSVTI